VEVRKKARSLEIQAEKAAKAKSYQKELTQLDQGYSHHQFTAVNEELKPLKERIENAEKEKKEISAKLATLEENEEKARNLLLEKERNQAEAQRRVSQLHASIREMETNLKITKEKIVNEEGVIKQYHSDIEQSAKDLTDLEKLRAQSIQKLENFSSEKERSEQSLKSSKERFNEVQQHFTKIRHELYELEIELSDANKKLNDLQSSRIKLESKLENSEDDRLRIDRDLEDLEDEIINSKGELNMVREKLDSKNTELEKKEKELESATATRRELEESREQLREEIRTVKSRLDAAGSEIALMQNIAESNDAIPGSVSYLMETVNDQFDLLAPVGEILHTSEEIAPALEAALGEAINFVVVNSMEDAIRASNILKDNKKGRATFIPLNELKASYPVADRSIAANVTCEKRFRSVSELLLGTTLLLDSMDDASKQLTGQPSVTSAVTPQGDLMTANKFLKSGSRNKQAGVRLGLKDKLEKLSAKSDELQRELAQKNAELEELNEKLKTLDSDSIRSEMKELQKDVRKLEQDASRWHSGIQVYEKNINDLNSRKKNLQSNLDMAQEELDSLHPRQKELQQKIKELSLKQSGKKKDLQKLEEERAIAQNRYNDAQLKHQDVKNKAHNLEREIERAESGIQNIQSRQASRKGLLDESSEKIKSYRYAIEQTEKQLEVKREQKREADQKLEEAEEASSRQRGTINEIEKELKEFRNQKEVNLELVHHLSMAHEKLEMKAQGYSDHIWETYGILMDQVQARLPEGQSPEQAKERVAWLKQKLQRIGDVNPLAIEEYKEEKERLDFYEEQIDDLHQAEKEMRETIDEINRTATERFNDTFEKIRFNFKNVFNTLFHEDDYCDLLIEQDVEDPLEAKIEIKANPKGKRPSSINQLSGGEKTLTAIALLFAIYLVKPSPFCVLDEVDAPLDDANIERFSSMIKKFSDDTQFIIITHNKKTMSKAEMMYGVTMPETGVSRLVGVKLDEVASA
jgi:chromosome segregation protein